MRALYWLFRSDRLSWFDVILYTSVLMLPLPAWVGVLVLGFGLLFSVFVEGLVTARHDDRRET